MDSLIHLFNEVNCKRIMNGFDYKSFYVDHVEFKIVGFKFWSPV